MAMTRYGIGTLGISTLTAMTGTLAVWLACLVAMAGA